MADETELLNKSIELVTKAKENGLTVRLLGGLAVAYHAPNGRAIWEYHRSSDDMDLFVLASERQKVSRFLEANGLVPDKHFNALHGVDWLQYFFGRNKVDVLVDEFRMCHRLPLKGRVAVHDVTIPPSDLLLTKLQIYEMNEKDIKDVLALLHDLRMSNTDSHTSIDAGYIAELLSSDWGLYKTVSMNLDRVSHYLESLQMKPNRTRRMTADLEYLKSAIQLRPKTLSWKLRSRIGEKVRWYELPEEVGYAVPAQTVVLPDTKEYVHEWVDLPQMQEMARSMAGAIMSKYGKPKAILYIERGGMVPAHMLGSLLGVSDRYGVQMVSRQGYNSEDLYILPHYISLDVKKGEYVLLVDDISDTGKTLRAALKLFRRKYGSIVTAAMAYKSQSVVRPDVIGREVPNGTWLVFDYESEESHISPGKTAPKAKRRARRGEFDALKANVRALAKAVLSSEGSPAAILYMTRSGLIMARLLSDALGTKRVVSVINNREIAGDYMRHMVHVCKRAVRDNKKGYVLLVDTTDSEIAAVRKRLAEVIPDVRVMTASLEPHANSVDFSLNNDSSAAARRMKA